KSECYLRWWLSVRLFSHFWIAVCLVGLVYRGSIVAKAFLSPVMHDSLSEDGNVFISLGVCAMAKKTKSKPMKEILRRLVKFQHIRVIVFEERMILKQPIEAWPVCDALISFYSDGFPLQKAIAYSKLRRPYLVNDLEAQYVLMDRKRVYECLQSEGIPVPRYACVERSDPKNPVNVIEHDDAIEIDGEVFHKPFVEKPLNAEDHNIYIYFPSSAGGGSQRLFRKVGDRSSKYFQISTIRTEGSYLYEEFMPTDGTDVKVYTVADDYAHAEARKSPALDGKVERDSEGKEIRYPVILTPREKIIAKKVAKVVKQQICGFDLLRANGMSYVCDVNGFSFVKTSRKYYDDCSHVLGVLITRVIAPRLCPTGMGPWITPGTDDDIPLVPTTCGTIMELRCVIAVFRHGDRTPKQKMKMDVRDERFFKLFKKYAGERTLELKLKKPTQLQEVLDIVRDILDDIESGKLKNSELEEKKAKFEQLRYVLEMYGSFSGINRKIQLKYQPNGRVVSTCKKKESGKNGTEDKNSVSLGDKLNRSRSGKSTTPSQGKGLLTAGREENEVDNVQSPDAAVCSSGATVDGDPCILLVVKWGGELTAAGRQQAEDLGRAFRCIYPGGDGNYGKNPGLGLLRLHSTYRHDLKIYASDEGRVQMTAAAFAKGFLALEGELPPILVQMVKSANTNGLLDNDNDCHQYQQMVKKRIKKVMAYKGVWGEEHRQALAPTGAKSLLNAMDFVRNPTEACAKLFGYVQRLANRVAMMTANPRERAKVALYHNESWDLLLRRWGKLVKDFRSPSGDYDVSKLPDIYDNIKYDIQHNSGILIESEMLDFFSLARALADIVVPQEYGITKEEKLVISQRICTPLLRKILSDARYTDVDECTRLHAGYSKGVASPERFVRTRLYFTSESHLHSILTCLQHGGLADAATDEQWKRAMDYVSTVPELNYLSQVVIMIYEDPTVEPKTEKKFHVELHFSPGAHALCRDLPAGSGFRPGRREIPKPLSSNDTRRGSVDQMIAPTEMSEEGTVTNTEESHASMRSHGGSEVPPKPGEGSRGSVIPSQGSSAYFPERPTDAAANVSVNDIVARELNALTYPNRQVQIDLKELQNCPLGNGSCDLNSPCPTRRVRGLISTAVIRGSRDTYSSSVPDLIQLLNCSDSGGHSQVETPQNPSDLMVPSAPSVPEIYPLETLHNAMTLHQLESFFARLTTTKFPSPFTSPRLSSAGGALPPTERTNMAVNEAPNTRYMNIITPTTFTNDADDRATSAAGEPQSKASWLISRRVERRSLSEPGATIATPNGSPGTAELKPLVKTGSFSSRKDDSVAMSATASPM
uniref:Inositol hexakisphosphate and diphosphoinositol-pentakisphosphate kinase n=1 Tax=Mesocestoides corti TaxID=53468 RepID=A0A5K3FKK7_MESCO